MDIIGQHLALNVHKVMEQPGATGNANGRILNAFPKVVFLMISNDKLMYSIKTRLIT